MKPNLIPCLSILCIAATLAASPQPASAQSNQDLLEVARSVVSADRKAVVVAAMQLTEGEAKEFWPLYRDYRSAMDQISDERIKLVLDYAKLYPDIPDDQAKEMLDTYTSLEQRQVEQRTVYLKKFRKGAPGGKALRPAQV